MVYSPPSWFDSSHVHSILNSREDAGTGQDVIHNFTDTTHEVELRQTSLKATVESLVFNLLKHCISRNPEEGDRYAVSHQHFLPDDTR